MARQSKTLRSLVETVNQRNRHSTCDPLVRQGWNSIVENALMTANAYAGYGYYRPEDLAEGLTPGMRTDAATGEKSFPDETRRFYYVK